MADKFCSDLILGSYFIPVSLSSIQLLSGYANTQILQSHDCRERNTEIGRKLMMIAFNKNNPLIKLNGLENDSELDEQEGYSHIFSGAVMAVRNPGGHEIELSDDPDVCLDHLAFGTFLLRRLERSGYKTA